MPFLALGGEIKRLHKRGVKVRDIKPERRTVIIIVAPNSLKSLPTTPPRKRRGIKTTVRDKVIDRIVVLISFEPFNSLRKGILFKNANVIKQSNSKNVGSFPTKL